jgi:hypothetical protein
MDSGTEGLFTSDDSRHRLPVIGLYGSGSSFTTVPLIMFGIGVCPRPRTHSCCQRGGKGQPGETSATGIRRLSDARHHPHFHSLTLV